MERKKHKMEPYTPLKGLRIEIGGIHYKIKYFKTITLMEPDDEEYDPESWTAGWSDMSGREIGIFAYLTKEEHDFVLLHELLHCTIEACKTDINFQKEDFVKPLSRFLFSTLNQCRILKRPRLKDV